MKYNKQNNSLVLRNFTFGVEDSLVSTVGLLAGIAIAGMPRESIITTGLVLIFVEAFSMAIGSLISEQSVEEYEEKQEVSMAKPIFAAVVMFFSYVLAGLVPLAPYFYSSGQKMTIISISLTLVALFFLGIFNAKLTHVRAWRDGIFTLLMGGVAILVGIAVGQIVGHF